MGMYYELRKAQMYLEVCDFRTPSHSITALQHLCPERCCGIALQQAGIFVRLSQYSLAQRGTAHKDFCRWLRDNDIAFESVRRNEKEFNLEEASHRLCVALTRIRRKADFLLQAPAKTCQSVKVSERFRHRFGAGTVSIQEERADFSASEVIKRRHNKTKNWEETI